MRKLSKAQEKALRQVAAGQVKLVYVGDNEHSRRVWNAVGKNGRNINPTYDALVRLDLICCPYIVRQEDNTRRVFLTIIGEDAVKALGLPGELIYQAFERDAHSSVSWEIRKEQGEAEPYVLYRNGEVYSRYEDGRAVYEVFRKYCPWEYDMEAGRNN